MTNLAVLCVPEKAVVGSGLQHDRKRGRNAHAVTLLSKSLLSDGVYYVKHLSGVQKSLLLQAIIGR